MVRPLLHQLEWRAKVRLPLRLPHPRLHTLASRFTSAVYPTELLETGRQQVVLVDVPQSSQ